MNDSQFYPNAITYSLRDTPFATIFDALDGSSSKSNWSNLVSELIDSGVKPVFNIVSDDVCIKAWAFLLPQLGFMPNILSVKISLAAGICNKDDLLTVFSSNKNWIDQASFRGALGDFLGIHNTQLIPLSMAVGREEDTQKLFDIFSNSESVIKYFEEKNKDI